MAMGVVRDGESVGRLVSGRRSGWGVFVKYGVELSVGFWLAIAWVGRHWDVGIAIGWGQRCGSIWSGFWWSETAWVSWSESQRMVSVD